MFMRVVTTLRLQTPKGPLPLPLTTARCILLVGFSVFLAGPRKPSVGSRSLAVPSPPLREWHARRPNRQIEATRPKTKQRPRISLRGRPVFPFRVFGLFRGPLKRNEKQLIIELLEVIARDQVPGMNVFLFTGAADQQFRLQSSRDLMTWSDGALLELLDSSGTLIYFEETGGHLEGRGGLRGRASVSQE